jgi:rhodanese-related sulfurtransferase
MTTAQATPIAKERQTSLGLYVTAQEAYDMWQADPDGVRMLDVRTPEEYVFVGHPPMAWNIPFAFQSYQWEPGKKTLHWELNADFVPAVKAWAKPDDTILLTCRSGARAAMAINMLAAAGFTNIYNIVDGMEGDRIDDPESVFHGMPMKNGWRNAALPWTYDLEPERMQLPEREEGSLQPSSPHD